ncbi:MAG: ribonucleotide-diphosphate reductase subunit beta [Thermoplasmatales archaeon]
MKRREVFAPFEYEEAYNYWLKQQNAHWLHTEVSMATDIQDWRFNLSESEKSVVGNTLKGFTQTEVIINDYWATKITRWFPKPELAMMSSAFSNMETIHMKAYAYLNESLGLTDFSAFMQEPTAKAKIDNLIETKGNSKADIAKSLAVFSGFAEGVQLFSSFAILMNFSRFNKLKGVGQIVAFSVRDESLHSEAGCWLFRKFIEENPEIWTDELKKEIYDAARTVVSLEDSFIDRVFELGEIEGLNPQDLKNYIRARTNTKLNDLGLKNNWKNVDKESVYRITEWFDFMTVGVQHTDFFALRVVDYSKGLINWDNMYEKENE